MKSDDKINNLTDELIDLVDEKTDMSLHEIMQSLIEAMNFLNQYALNYDDEVEKMKQN